MKVNALKLRQAFGEVLKRLQKSGEPIIVEKGRKPVAVLISIEDFNTRFIDLHEQKKRDEILQAFHDNAVSVKENSTTVLRDIRYG